MSNPVPFIYDPTTMADPNMATDAPSTPAMPHAHACLAEAERVINGPRRGSYGDVHSSFEGVAAVWSVVLRQTITPQQVAQCMIALKLCREANTHTHDNLVDLCGYTALLAELEGGVK